MALLKSRISENSTQHHIMKITKSDKIKTHVYIHTTLFFEDKEGQQHEEHIKIVKNIGQNKRVHKKIVLDKSSKTLYNWRRVDSSEPGASTLENR